MNEAVYLEMAIWQYNIYFLPKLTLINRYGEIPAVLQIGQEEDDPLSIQWWLDLNIQKSEFEDLLKNHASALPRAEPYDNVLSFGHIEEYIVFVVFDKKNCIEEVYCRLDLRSLTSDIISVVINIASKYDCLLMDSKGKKFNPQPEEIFDSIRLSNANRFVNDPEKFLNDLHNGSISIE